MRLMAVLGAVLPALALLASAAHGGSAGDGPVAVAPAAKIELTVTSANGPHLFQVEVARTQLEQERGLMFRTDIPADGGMLFAPYPAEGGGPRDASFWMSNTPTALDIIFIRANGTIAKIAENAVPLTEDRLLSDEPVSAVLEINAGRSAALGIKAGDKVSWAGRRK